jgi:hypothetical protein
MYKNFNLTESEKQQILEMHKAHGYKKPLNEEMEDVDLGDRLRHDSASDFPNNNPYGENMKVIRKITQDINVGPNGIGGGPSPDNFNKIRYAFDLAINKYGNKYNLDDVANALYHALYGFDDEDTSDDVQDNNVDYLHNEKPLNEGFGGAFVAKAANDKAAADAAAAGKVVPQQPNSLSDVAKGGYLRFNMKGNVIRDMQVLLNSLNYPEVKIDTNAYFNQQTLDAVIFVQKKLGIKPKGKFGIFGPITLAAVNKAKANAAAVTPTPAPEA